MNNRVAVIAHQLKSLDGGLPQLRHELAEAGISDPLWYEVPKSKFAPKRVRQALKEGADLVIAWGGDGSAGRQRRPVAGRTRRVPGGRARRRSARGRRGDGGGRARVAARALARRSAQGGAVAVRARDPRPQDRHQTRQEGAVRSRRW